MASLIASFPHTLQSYTLVLVFCARAALSQRSDADPFTIPFDDGNSIGPDGPWNYILQAVDYPDQNISLVPSVSYTSLIVASEACSGQSAHCPLPLPELLTLSGSYEVSDGLQTQSNAVGPTSWDTNYAGLLNMKKYGTFQAERFTLHETNGIAFLDRHASMVSNNFTVNYPGGDYYTMDTGFISLYGGEQTYSWDAVNGTRVTYNRTLPDAYYSGNIPSISYGLHLGSPTFNIPGSLVLGGYDQSRCLTNPAVSNETYIELVDLALNIFSGGSAYTNLSSGYVDGLLMARGSQISSLQVYPRPGLPYLYLPKVTCEAIAEYLPVSFNTNYNIYTWNTNEQAYTDIVSSPHYLAFTFASSDGGQSTINVPFALLNLTLESPVISTPIQYFPCSPLPPAASEGNTLGSAFLQAAFLAQNWQTNKLFLAQAPGPDYQPRYMQSIASTDLTLAPAANPPDWVSTWQNTLKALPVSSTNSTGNGTATGNQGGGQKKSSSGISGGAIAGIVVGAVAVLAISAGLAFWFMRRRRRNRRNSNSASSNAPLTSQHQSPLPPQYLDHPGVGQRQEKCGASYVEADSGQRYVEADSMQPPVELSAYGDVSELPGRRA